MTTLIAWTSRDQRHFAALHVASDSRITWGSAANRWDAGRKIFASSGTPDVWAYSGDVLFPALVLSQLMNAANAGLLFGDTSSALERNAIVFEVLKSSFHRRHNTPDQKFTILHASRDGEKAQAEPRLWQISFDPNGKKWQNEMVAINNFAGVVAVNGSGRRAANDELKRWQNSDIGGTSRSIYSAFCSAVMSGQDSLSGGAPQIASIYPKGPAVIAGTNFENSLHLFGLPIPPTSGSRKIEWFDPLFQRIDPITQANIDGAARHATPKFKEH